MLRPERMSRVSVTGSKRVMDEVIETAHELHLLHLSDYGNDWEGFAPGDPIEGADDAAQKLVTVRALESTLEVTEDDAGPGTQLVTDEALEEQLEEIRQEVNELDDRRAELRDELRAVEDNVDRMEPFVRLGIDLDLLGGYDSVAVEVGEGDAADVRETVADSDLDAYEVFDSDGVVAVVARTDESTLRDVLVNATFTAIEVPDAEGDPEDYLSEQRHRKQQLEARLSTVEEDMEDLRLDYGGFLLAAEEQLTIEVNKLEAPLAFATTANAFIAEGWVPTDEYAALESALAEAVGEHVEVSELERASYDRDDHEHVAGDEDDPDHGATGTGTPAAATGTDAPAAGESAATEAATEESEEEEVAVDGGRPTGAAPTDDGDTVTMGPDEPPVVQDNPGIVKPFELLTNAVGRPNYSELDPTIILWATFPVLFGFMIGDVGYGLIYSAIGYYVYRRFDSSGMRNFGLITLAAGLMTTLFGVLYGEIFGLHTVSSVLWGGHAPLKKGLMPANLAWAQAWFLVTALFGVLHMTLGYAFEFVENFQLHGLVEAVEESGSWLLALPGIWLFIFSTLFADSKPNFLFDVFNTGENAAVQLGFAGLPGWLGWVGVAMVVLGVVLLVLGPTHELVEIHVILAHALSYLRIAAVLLAKAGMAFAVNLLFFGAYNHHGEFHFMTSYGPEYVAEHYPEAEVMFGGMYHGGIAMLVAGIFVLIVGHLVVLALGVTSAGIQSIRLEYFEFFSKFYEGDGTPYEPFGQDRDMTAET